MCSVVDSSQSRMAQPESAYNKIKNIYNYNNKDIYNYTHTDKYMQRFDRAQYIEQIKNIRQIVHLKRIQQSQHMSQYISGSVSSNSNRDYNTDPCGGAGCAINGLDDILNDDAIKYAKNVVITQIKNKTDTTIKHIRQNIEKTLDYDQNQIMLEYIKSILRNEHKFITQLEECVF